MSTAATNLKIIQGEFKQQASVFEAQWEKRSMRSTADIMKWVINVIGPVNKDTKALDVATGTGIFARALADAGCSSVLGIDATKEMLDQARNTLPSVNNITPKYVQCDAASMPFPDDSFDLVTCRLAVHHFAHPAIQLKEIVRV